MIEWRIASKKDFDILSRGLGGYQLSVVFFMIKYNAFRMYQKSILFIIIFKFDKRRKVVASRYKLLFQMWLCTVTT